MQQLLGAHTSTSGGVSKSVDLAETLGFTAMQIFTKNNNRWFQKPLDEKEIEAFKTKLINSKIKFVVSHDSYLINLCGTDKEILKKSRIALLDELERCELLGIPHLNFHPGSHLGAGEDDGIKLIAESINIVHDKTKGYKVSSMLETTAGQGTAIGYRFEQLQKIIDLGKLAIKGKKMKESYANEQTLFSIFCSCQKQPATYPSKPGANQSHLCLFFGQEIFTDLKS